MNGRKTNAEKWFNLIKEHEFDISFLEEQTIMFQEVVKTVIFSAMTIEAFLNDYAAACLGDSEYYDSFDQLSILSKLELIAKFILKANIDKSRAYYSNLKSLVKYRNNYIHSKSKHTIIVGYSSLEEMPDEEELFEFFNEFGPLTLDQKEIRDDLNIALIGIKAIRDIMAFFDSHDEDVHATQRTFWLGAVGSNKIPKDYRNHVFSVLGIKERDYGIPIQNPTIPDRCRGCGCAGVQRAAEIRTDQLSAGRGFPAV